MNIDQIMELLDWNRNPDDQALGIKLGMETKCINVFLQPCNDSCGKNVWDNCAIILTEKTDRELEPYLFDLLRWIQDMNWPGAFRIFKRLGTFSDKRLLNRTLRNGIKIARALDDSVWETTLRKLQKLVNKSSGENESFAGESPEPPFCSIFA